MKIIAVCDLDGNIETMMTMSVDGPRVSVPGLPSDKREIELEVPEGTHRSDFSHLKNLRSDYYVDLPSAKLVTRKAK